MFMAIIKENETLAKIKMYEYPEVLKYWDT